MRTYKHIFWFILPLAVDCYANHSIYASLATDSLNMLVELLFRQLRIHERYMIIKQLESMLMVLLTIFAKSNPSPNLFFKKIRLL